MHFSLCISCVDTEIEYDFVHQEKYVHVSLYGVTSSSIMSRSKSLQGLSFPLVYIISCFKFKVLNQCGEKLIRKFVSINYY